jgi:anaerobic selenocysteine-containing dehydrogenase
VADAVPWASLKDALREAARGLQQLNRGPVREASFERFWTRLLQQGGWWDDAPTPGPPPVPASFVDTGELQRAIAQIAPRAGAADAAYPFALVLFEHNSLGAGEAAHLPWLQAAPDPLTSVTWQTWVEVNPGVAKRLGLREGDVVRVESGYGKVEAPVYVPPAAPPDVLAMPLGQGHRAYGRWAERRGANPLDLLGPETDQTTGALAYGAARVRLVKTGRRQPLPKLEGTVPAYQLPGDEAKIIKVTRQ